MKALCPVWGAGDRSWPCSLALNPDCWHSCRVPDGQAWDGWDPTLVGLKVWMVKNAREEKVSWMRAGDRVGAAGQGEGGGEQGWARRGRGQRAQQLEESGLQFLWVLESAKGSRQERDRIRLQFGCGGEG